MRFLTSERKKYFIAKLNTLREQLDAFEPKNILESLDKFENQLTLTQIDICFSEKENVEIEIGLEHLLLSRWIRIHCSNMRYTQQPDNLVNQLCIEIAREIALPASTPSDYEALEIDSKKTDALIMPNLSNTHHWYRHLKSLGLYEFGLDNQRVWIPLEQFVLLENRELLEARCTSGNDTALNIAVMTGKAGVVNSLLQQGAKVNARNHQCKNALDIAITSQPEFIEPILMELATYSEAEQAECLLRVPGGPYADVYAYVAVERPEFLNRLILNQFSASTDDTIRILENIHFDEHFARISKHYQQMKENWLCNLKYINLALIVKTVLIECGKAKVALFQSDADEKILIFKNTCKSAMEKAEWSITVTLCKVAKNIAPYLPALICLSALAGCALLGLSPELIGALSWACAATMLAAVLYIFLFNGCKRLDPESVQLIGKLHEAVDKLEVLEPSIRADFDKGFSNWFKLH